MDLTVPESDDHNPWHAVEQLERTALKAEMLAEEASRTASKIRKNAVIAALRAIGVEIEFACFRQRDNWLYVYDTRRFEGVGPTYVVIVDWPDPWMNRTVSKLFKEGTGDFELVHRVGTMDILRWVPKVD